MGLKPLRKDAAERRSAILGAARAVFTEDGIDTPLDRIAERAGVGRATLYRNFPGRTEIALAVLLEDVAELEAAHAESERPEAFADFLSDLSGRLVRNAALAGAVRASPSSDILAPLRAALTKAGAPALRVSQAAGAVRADLEPSDIRVLSAMLGSGLHNAAPDERDAMAGRTLGLVLDAVRPRS